MTLRRTRSGTFSGCLPICAPPSPNRPRKPGRPPTTLADAMFATCFKVYSGFSARRFAVDLEEARERGYLSRSLGFNTVLDAMDNPALTPILMELVRVSSLPLA